MNGDEWDVYVLDLDAYLTRVAHPTHPDGGPAALRSLHRAHVAAVPFENLDVVLGRGVDVDLGAVQAKLVGRRRGGYCHEHGLLVSAALQRCGYGVERLLARVAADRPQPAPRTHLVARVTASDGSRWLVDTGFGPGPVEPVPWSAGMESRQGRWTYRVVPGERSSLLQERTTGADWATLYAVADEPAHPSDVVVANHYTSTSPRSPFVPRPLVVRKDDEVLHRLTGRRLTRTRPGHPTDDVQLDDAGFRTALADLGLDLDAETLDQLVAQLP